MKLLQFLSLLLIALYSLSAPGQNELEQLNNYISGGQLVIYSRSSYVSDDNASAITYIDFCPDGRYTYYYEGSYTVKGTPNTSNRNHRANGAKTAKNQGRWSVLKHEAEFYLEIIDYKNEKTYYPINWALITNGRWKQGNVTYAFDPNKGNCE